MSRCFACPRGCGVDREQGRGWCGAPALPFIARGALHLWEEPYISGERGSGAIFFCGCNMGCLFCQNHEISRGEIGQSADFRQLADIMLRLEALGAHNINLVTPTPHIDTLIPAIHKARDSGLSLPIVYNTNGYETLESIRRLDGLVDIYLPDLKYVTPEIARRYSNCEDYFLFASPALKEMFAQCGNLVLNDAGLALRGMAIRHLVLPGALPETRRVLDYIRENFPKDIYISLMGQYVPCYKADFVPLNRKLLKREYERAIEYCVALGLKNVLIQELSSASGAFTPLFDGRIS